MTRRGQHVCVLAGLLTCLALTAGFAASPEPARTAVPAGDDFGLAALDAKTPSPRPRPATYIVPEGVAVLLVTVIWTASMALLSGPRGDGALRRALTVLLRRRSFG